MARIRFTMLAVGVVMLLAASPALGAQPGKSARIVTATGQTITATGTGESRVRPRDRHSNSSIVTAYDAAHNASIAGAIQNAREYARIYARTVGLTLGPLISLSDQQSAGFYGPGSFFGPFGPNQFCGTEREPVFKQVNGRRKVIGTRKVHRCVVPRFAYTTLTLTYSVS